MFANKYSSSHPFIIAEIGTAHGGDIYKARELIAAAAESGADCVKTQIVFADEILHPAAGIVPLPGGAVPLYDVFKKLEAPFEFFAEFKTAAEDAGLIFLASPFGAQSAALLRRLNPAFVKIASPELNWTALLSEVASWNLPVLLSSGVSKLADIEAALAIIGTSSTCLMHCVTAYPAPAGDYNLRVLQNLHGIFGVAVGVSDHSAEVSLVPLLALSQGAAVIEKHFCLSRAAGGLDDPIALPPVEFTALCRAVRAAQTLSGDAVIERARAEYGGVVDVCLGGGVKRLAPSEAANYERTNRSIHALRAISSGEIITRDMISVLRTEKILRPGLPPSFFNALIGRAARTDIPAGEGIRFEDV